ncbi:MAG: hypothetical protein WBW44_08805, partial [Solirubrobacterales bacterium]
MRSGKLLGGARFVGLLAVCLLAMPGSSAALDEVRTGPALRDSEPQFMQTVQGERILFARAELHPDGSVLKQDLMTMRVTGDGLETLIPSRDGTTASDAATSRYSDTFAYVTGPIITSGYYESGLLIKRPSKPDLAETGIYPPTRPADPAVSDDGSKVAHVWGGSVSVKVEGYGVDHRVPVPYPGYARTPSFAPDGDHVAYETYASGGPASQDGIWTARAGDSEMKQLTGTTDENPCYRDSNPVWVPTTGEVIFVRNANPCGDPALAGLWRVDPGATFVENDWPQGKQLVAGQSDDVYFDEPTVSNDGSTIAFTRKHKAAAASELTAIYTYDGSRTTRISDPAEGSISVDSHPSFSNSGRKLAYVRRAEPQGSGSPSDDSGIRVVDVSP